MIPSDSTSFLLEAAKALAEPLPEPPQPLPAHARAFWPQIIKSKRRDAWTEIDLLAACQLARDLSACEVLSEELDREGAVITGKNGRMKNPAASLLDAASRRVLAAMKTLQIHAHATQGRSEHVANKNQAARELAEKIQAADSLIPRPLQ